MEPTRRERALVKKLKEVTEKNREFIWWLDREMQKPSTHERGKRVAEAVNAFQLYNDGVRYAECGIDFRKDKPYRPKRERPVAAPPPEPRYTRAEVVAEILRYRHEGSTTYTDIFNNALEILAERVFPPEAAPKETQG